MVQRARELPQEREENKEEVTTKWSVGGREAVQHRVKRGTKLSDFLQKRGYKNLLGKTLFRNAQRVTVDDKGNLVHDDEIQEGQVFILFEQEIVKGIRGQGPLHGQGLIYSPAAARVLNELRQYAEHDYTTEIFTRRAALAITNYDAGMVRQSPVGSFLMKVPQSITLDRMLNSFAEAWLGGKAYDGRRVFFNIDCSSPDPRVFLSLVGGVLGSNQVGQGLIIKPGLKEITQPHFVIRGAEVLKNISDWREWFFKENKDDLARLRYSGKFDVFREHTRVLIEEEQNKYYEILREEAPFLSVVVFNGVCEFTYPGVLDIIHDITNYGLVTVWPNHPVDFSSSIVIVVCRNHLNFKASTGMGFNNPDFRDDALEKDRFERSKRAYFEGRRELSITPQVSSLLGAMGENIFVFRGRTTNSQKRYLAMALADIRQKLEQLCVHINWSENFIEEFTKDTRDEEFGSYTDGRLRNGIDKHILFPIAQLIISKGLKRASSLYFDAKKGELGDFTSLCSVKEEGGGDIVSPLDMHRVWMGEVIRSGESSDQIKSLVNTNDLIKRLNSRAERMLQET